jgi:hypothetical protein
MNKKHMRISYMLSIFVLFLGLAMAGNPTYNTDTSADTQVSTHYLEAREATLLATTYGFSHTPPEQISSFATREDIELYENEQAEILELQNSITGAILTKLTVWHNSIENRPIYVEHCREMRHGCEAQVRQFVNYIVEVSREHGIDPWLFAGMAWHESRFNPSAASSMGAYGIFQILRAGPASVGLPFVHQRWFREACSRDLGVCQRPIVERAAVWLLASAEHCGSMQDGLRAYNSGDCEGPRRYYRAVFAARDELFEIAHR